MAEKRILIVDDDDVIRMTFSKILKLEGYLVSDVNSGEAALTVLEEEEFALLIVDLKMGGMGGMELIQRVLEKYPRMKIIVITAHGTVKTAVEALRQRLHDYMLKPVTMEEILVSVQRAFEESAQEIEMAEARLEYGRRDDSNWKLCESVTVNTKLQRIYWGEESRNLTPSESRFLGALLESKGAVLSYVDLVYKVHGYHVEEEEAAVILRPMVSRLRQKLDETPCQGAVIQTVRGAGYLISPVV